MELDDLNQELVQEREDLLDTIRELDRELKYKILLSTHFIPPMDLFRIEQTAYWDNGSDAWVLQMSQFAGNSLRKRREASTAMRKESAAKMGLAGMPGAPGDEEELAEAGRKESG